MNNPGVVAEIDSATAAGGTAGMNRTTKEVGDPAKGKIDQSQKEDRASYQEQRTFNGEQIH